MDLDGHPGFLIPRVAAPFPVLAGAVVGLIAFPVSTAIVPSTRAFMAGATLRMTVTIPFPTRLMPGLCRCGQTAGTQHQGDGGSHKTAGDVCKTHVSFRTLVRVVLNTGGIVGAVCEVGTGHR